jgi:hypothetical protein
MARENQHDPSKQNILNCILIQVHGLEIRQLILDTPNNAHNNLSNHISDTQNKHAQNMNPKIENPSEMDAGIVIEQIPLVQIVGG